MLRPMLLLVLREITVGHVLPIFGFHDSVSLSDQRAEGRSSDGLAAVAATLDGAKKRLGFIQLRLALLDQSELGVHTRAEIQCTVGGKLPYLGEGQPGALQRE